MWGERENERDRERWKMSWCRHSGISSYKDTNPIAYGPRLFWPHLTLITSSEAPSLSTATLGFRASIYEFWRDPSIQFITIWKPQPVFGFIWGLIRWPHWYIYSLNIDAHVQIKFLNCFILLLSPRCFSGEQLCLCGSLSSSQRRKGYWLPPSMPSSNMQVHLASSFTLVWIAGPHGNQWDTFLRKLTRSLNLQVHSYFEHTYLESKLLRGIYQTINSFLRK